MLVKYKRKANIAAGVWLVSIVPLIAFVATAGEIAEAAQGAIQLLFIVVLCGSYWYGCWALAKAKGYSGLLGLVLPLLSILGLIILVALRDKQKEGEPTAARNAP